MHVEEYNSMMRYLRFPKLTQSMIAHQILLTVYLKKFEFKIVVMCRFLGWGKVGQGILP